MSLLLANFSSPGSLLPILGSAFVIATAILGAWGLQKNGALAGAQSALLASEKAATGWESSHRRLEGELHNALRELGERKSEIVKCEAIIEKLREETSVIRAHELEEALTLVHSSLAELSQNIVTHLASNQKEKGATNA